MRDELWPAERRRRTRHIYIHLRTRVAAEHGDDEEVDALLATTGLWDVEELWFPDVGADGADDGEGWDDGLLLRCPSGEPIDEFVKARRAELDAFDAWIVHDGSDFAEGPVNGPLSIYLEGNAGRAAVMVCMMSGEGERDLDDLTDRVRRAIGPQCRAVTYFRNGRIFFAPSALPMQQYGRRLESLRRRIKHLAAVNTVSGETFYGAAERFQLWHSMFEDDEPEA